MTETNKTKLTNKQSQTRLEASLTLAIKRLTNSLDYVVLIFSLLILALGAFALYDSHLLLETASAEEYASYKPDSKDSLSYKELRKLNQDVIGWLEIYGTKIDYPIVQGKDNFHYLNYTVTGEFSTAGSIFLDAANKRDFSDFNNILYGHYMAERKMFGDLGLFANEDFFNKHEYGVINRNDLPSLGLHFLCFLQTVGSDSRIFNPKVIGKQEQKDFVQYLLSKAKYKRELDIKENDRLVIMDTCNFEITDGRYILVAKLEDTVQSNNFISGTIKPLRMASWLAKIDQHNLFYISLSLWLLSIILYLFYKLVKKLAQPSPRKEAHYVQ